MGKTAESGGGGLETGEFLRNDDHLIMQLRIFNMLNRTTILAALMTLSLGTLGGCSTVDGMGKDLANLFGTSSSQPSGEKIDLGSSKDGETWTDANGNPMPAPTQNVDLSYNRLAGEYTNSSVELFSLDTPGQPVSKMAGASMTGNGIEGMPSSTDPSVTVFPFSDDMYTPGVRPGVNGYGRRPAPSMMADSSNLDAVPMYTGNPNTIYFNHGSSALNAAARQVIASVARSYNGMVMVDGHASRRTETKDPVKAALINFQMSMKRAMNVTRKLIEQGVPPHAIKVTAHGDAEPAVPENTREDEAKNRRVEIHTGTK